MPEDMIFVDTNDGIFMDTSDAVWDKSTSITPPITVIFSSLKPGGVITSAVPGGTITSYNFDS